MSQTHQPTQRVASAPATGQKRVGKSRLYRSFLMVAVFIGMATFLASLRSIPPPPTSPLPSLKESFVERRKYPDGPPEVDYHIVFSTSCSPQQHWESYVFFYHAFKVDQPGNVTRIVSGCSDKDREALEKFHDDNIRTLNPRFSVHFTPGFEHITNERFGYKYMNKPYGLRHWMENELKMNTTHPPELENDIVILMDPDMVLLRPITHDYAKEEVKWIDPTPLTTSVRHGYPMAQQDGYLDNKWMFLNISYITGDPNSPVQNLTRPDGPRYWNTGPPYLATVRDMYKISVKWTEYAPRVYEVFPKLFAEMFGYIIATVQLNLPHTLIKSLVVSTTTTQREGWEYVDALEGDHVCKPPSIADLPVAMHYCKRYMLGKWFFSKYRLKKDFVSCRQPLLMLPPLNVSTLYDYWIPPPPANHKEADPLPTERHNISPRQAKREGFMLCNLMRSVNEASLYFKKHHCSPGEANFNETYSIHESPGKY